MRKNLKQATVQEKVEEKKEELSQRMTEYINSDEFLKWAEQKAEPMVKDQLKGFFEENEDKLQEYARDPQKLKSDFEQYANILDYVNYLLLALDIGTVAWTVLSAISAPATGGASIGSAIGVLGLRQVAKQGLRQVAKKVIRRLIDRLSLRMLKRYMKKGAGYAFKGAKLFSTSVIRELKWRITAYIFLRTLYSTVQGAGIATLSAAKHSLKKRGADLQVPQDVIDKATDPDIQKKTFLQIIDKQMEDFSSYTKELLSREGMQSVGMMAAARMIGLRGIAMRRSYQRQLESTVEKVRSGKISAPGYPKGDKEEEEDKSEHYEKISDELAKSTIPSALHYRYEKMLKDLVNEAEEGEDPSKQIEERINQAEETTALAVETLKELAVLDIIEENKDTLTSSIRHEEILENLLDDVVNIQVTDADALMHEHGVSSLGELIAELREDKEFALYGVLSRLALGEHDRDTIHNIRESLYYGDANIDEFKMNLEAMALEGSKGLKRGGLDVKGKVS